MDRGGLALKTLPQHPQPKSDREEAAQIIFRAHADVCVKLSGACLGGDLMWCRLAGNTLSTRQPMLPGHD